MSKDRYPESAWVFYFMKKCSKCKIEKSLDNFPKCNSGTKDGLGSWCKCCVNNNQKQWREKNKNIVKEINKINYNNNRTKNIEKAKEYQKKNIDKIIEYRKEYNNKNQDIIKEYRKEYYKQNQDIIKEKRKEYNKNYKNKYPYIQSWRNILKNTLLKLNQIKSSSTLYLLQYTPQELKEHLDNLGMDWEKHQVDHKIPITWFKPETPPHIVNDLRNLQPLEESINKSKKNRYNHKVDITYLKIAKKWIKEEFTNKLEI